MVGVIGGGILELLEEAVDGGADFSGVRGLRQQTEHGVARGVPCGIAWTPPEVAMFLPPAVFGGT